MRVPTLAVLLLFALPAAAQGPTAREIFEEVDRRQKRVTSEQAEVRMEIVDARGRARTRQLQTFTKVGDDGRSRALLVFTGPADIRGTGLLTVETPSGDDQRLYLPAVGRVQRVAGGQRAERFAGSDFTFEDLGSRNPDHYDVRLLETRADAYVIEARPRPEANSQYGRIVLTVDRQRYAITRAEHYGRDGRLAKTLTAERFREVAPGTFRADRLQMEDARSGRRTVLTFLSRDTRRPLPDDLFTERHLQRAAR